jgi:hypothetical protein
MIHIDPWHAPFAVSMLPFLALGVCLPVIVTDRVRGKGLSGDMLGLVILMVVALIWYWAILRSVAGKRAQGAATWFGRPLHSWVWAPRVAFLVGLVLSYLTIMK